MSENGQSAESTSDSMQVGGQGGGSGSVRERVYAAAARISAERRPTVSTVRAEAGVSNADATRYLKEWVEEQNSAHRAVAAAPPALLEQAARLAGAVWVEASAIAAERHATVEAAWAQESKDRDLEVAELVADLDRTATEKDALVADFTAKITAMEEQLNVREEESREARRAARTANEEATAALRDLTEARTQATTLQGAYDALLQRITPQGEGAEAESPQQ